MGAISAAYQRRQPEKTVMYQVLQNHLATFVERAEASGRTIPDFVLRELDRFLDCGILARGFVRVACGGCKTEHLVALSCKGDLCPSCGGRRMNERAAFLIDYVLPQTPVRQWVLSLPFRLRYFPPPG